MTDDPDTPWTERRERAFRELCDLGMGLARKLAAQAEEAQTIPETERCAEAFEKMARSVRLTFALQARLEREDRRSVAEEVKARKVQVRDALHAVIRPTGTFGQRVEREQELDDRLAFEILAPDFLDLPVDALIARIGRDLGLPVVTAVNEAPPPRGPGAGGWRAPAKARPSGGPAPPRPRGFPPPS